MAVISAEDAAKELSGQEKPVFDPSAEDIELAHVATIFMPMNGAQGLTINAHFSSGFAVSGIVRRMTLEQGDRIRVLIEIGASNQHFKTGNFGVLYFRQWLYVEVDHSKYRDIEPGTRILP